MTPRLVMASAVLMFVVGFAASDDKKPTLGDKIAEYCTKNKGKQVGDGECAALATESLKAAGAKGRQKDSPKDGDYVWGDLTLTAEVKNNKLDVTGKFADVKPGDVIQFRDTKWVTRSGNRTSTMTALHHTAVVVGVDKTRSTLRILHQNNGGQKIVQEGTLPLGDLKEGWIRVYRPVAE